VLIFLLFVIGLRGLLGLRQDDQGTAKFLEVGLFAANATNGNAPLASAPLCCTSCLTHESPFRSAAAFTQH
jgi:hypothetical protein